MLWELLFMLVILKIPVAYLCIVVYWAIKAEPRPLEGAARLVRSDLPPGTGWSRGRGSSAPGRDAPHRPGGRFARHAARAAGARARSR